MGVLDRILEIGIEGRGPFAGAAEIAAIARAEQGATEGAISSVIDQHVRAGAVGGFVTSLGGFVTLPIAIPVNVAEFYVLATRMVAAVADLRGYDLRSAEVRTAILLTLVGHNPNEVLHEAGIPVPASTGIVGPLLLNRLPKSALMVAHKAIGFRFLRSVSQRTLSRLGRLVPVVGGVLGAGMDGFLMRQIGKAAKRDFAVGWG